MLGPYRFSLLLCLSLHEVLLGVYFFFFEEISSFPLFLWLVHSRRLSFLSLLFSGTLHSVRYIFPFLLCLFLLFSAICKAPSDNHFAFLHFFFLGMILVTTSCTVLTDLHPQFFRHSVCHI